MELLSAFKLEACTAAKGDSRPLLETVAVQPFDFRDDERERLAKLVESPVAKKHMQRVNAVAMVADGFVLAVVPCVLEPQDVGPTDGGPFPALDVEALRLARRFKRHSDVLSFTLTKNTLVLDAWTTIKRGEPEVLERSYPDLFAVTSRSLAAYVRQKHPKELNAAHEMIVGQRAHVTMDLRNVDKINRALGGGSTGLTAHIGSALEAVVFTKSGVNRTKAVRYTTLGGPGQVGVVPVPPFALVMPMHTVHPDGEGDALDRLRPVDLVPSTEPDAVPVVHNAQVGRAAPRRERRKKALATAS